jgi:hypothetical protein
MRAATREPGREGVIGAEYRPDRSQRFLALGTLRGVAIPISFRLSEVPMVALGKVHEPLLRSSIKRVRAKLGLLNQA